MSQHDFDIANQAAPAFRSDLNDALEALATLSSGATAPATTYANQLWYDTANNTLKMRSEADDAWIAIGVLNQSTNTFEVDGLEILDEDDMASNSATAVPTQQSTKAYVDGQALGVGQSWSDQTASRALSTIYTNTTGRTIVVAVSAVYTDDGLSLQVGGVVACRHETGSGTGVHTATIRAEVPPGATYQAVITAGAPSLSYWAELS